MTTKPAVTTYFVTASPLVASDRIDSLERYLVDNLKRIETAVNNLDLAVKALEERVKALEPTTP